MNGGFWVNALRVVREASVLAHNVCVVVHTKCL